MAGSHRDHTDPENGQPDPDRDQAPEAEEPRDDAEPNGEDDLRSRFRAVLERKRGEARNRSARGHGAGSSRIGDVHRRAGGKRTFRRKSG